jgi:formylglycine-generating enzyme required for sulfatase activity
MGVERISRLTGLAVASCLCFFAEASFGSERAARMPIGPFAIEQTEVSIGDFKAFARATRLITTAELAGGGHEFSGSWVKRQGWTFERPTGAFASDNEPAVHVTWGEARDYCAYAGGRLPTRAEWRLAAYTEQRERPTDGFVRGRTYVFPVGDQPAGMNNNRRRHVAVGATKRGVNGLYEMGANVWEWLADRQDDEALTAGGSWWFGPEQSKENGVQWKSARFFALDIGFRCAYDVR